MQHFKPSRNGGQDSLVYNATRDSLHELPDVTSKNQRDIYSFITLVARKYPQRPAGSTGAISARPPRDGGVGSRKLQLGLCSGLIT